MSLIQKRLIGRIAISSSILFFVLLFGFFFIIPDILLFLICFFAYLIVGYDVIYKTFKHCFKFRFFNEQSLMFIATVGAFIS